MNNKVGTSIANSFEDSVVYAKTLGCVLKVPKENQVFVDIDSGEAFDEYRTRLLWLLTQIAIKEVSVTPSKSSWPHCHVILETNFALTDAERIVFQVLLGGCADANLCSFRNLLLKDEHPVRFFEKE